MLTKHIQLFFLIILFISTNLSAQSIKELTLVPCSGNKIFNSSTTEKDLIKKFGADNIIREERWFAEGTEKHRVTVVYPETEKEFYIKWIDTVNFAEPEWLEIYSSESRIQLKSGIKIGTPLEELVKLNDKHFSFSGFDWDYGGYVDFEGGKLEKVCYYIRLAYDYEQMENLTEEEISSIVGEVNVLTSNPLLNKLKVYVDSITFYF